MKKKEIWQMALASGLCDSDLSSEDQICTDYGDATEAVERFAVMVADKAIAEYKALGNFAVAEEREACAIACEKWADYWTHPGDELRNDAAIQCAYEIRMRSNV